MTGQAHSLLRLLPSQAPASARTSLEPAPSEPTLQALLVTDLVAFTPMLLRMGDLEGLQLIRLHNSMLRECFKQYGGREVTHTGDGMLGAFRSVRSSLLCALEIQRRLAAHSAACPDAQLHARVGIHLGEPLPEEGRLFGSCVNAVVRICAAAGPGSILVSDLVRQIARGPNLHFIDQGSVALKGLDESFRLFELIDQGEASR